MPEFLMPKLGADMTAGKLVAWRKKPGDEVKRGEIVAEVETDKGVIDIEVFNTGVLERLLVQPGETVPVGAAIATIRDGYGEIATPKMAAAPAATVSDRQPAAAPQPPSAPIADWSRLRMSPSARRRARELNVDPTNVHGTGPHGAVTREDIEQAAVGRVQPPEPARPFVATTSNDAAARMRRTIAAAMSRSKREIPHYYLQTTIDLGRCQQWVKEENLKRPITERFLPAVVLLKAVAVALKQVPELNATWEGERLIVHPDVHLGVAISLRQGGLVAPALHAADQQPLDLLMRNFRDLVGRARSGGLRSSEFSDPTITVTSLGDQGVESLFGVIYPPQVALVGLGKIVERPWVVTGAVVPRPVVNATLSADHRVSDGHRGALFLAALDQLLQEPERL